MRGDRIPPGGHGVIRTVKVKPGKWRAECYARDSRGNLRRIQRSGSIEAEAARKLLLSLTSTTVSGVKSVADLMDRWLDQHGGISVSTRESYRYSIGHYIVPVLGQIGIEELSTPIVNDAIRSIYADHSLFAAKHSRTLLRMACKWGTLMSLIERDFTAEVPLPKQRGARTRAWAPGEEHIERLCSLLREDFEQDDRTGPRSPSAWLAAELMRSTGARIGEVCAARWENVDWEIGTITYEDTVVYEEGRVQLRGHLKNSDPYRVSYPPLPMLHLLRRFRQDSGPIVAARGGGTMQTNNLRRAWRRVYDRAGVPAQERVRPHDLRRAVGTKLTAELGIDAASAQLGDTRDITERHFEPGNFAGRELHRQDRSILPFVLQSPSARSSLEGGGSQIAPSEPCPNGV